MDAHERVAELEGGHARTDGCDIARELVTEGRRHWHLRVPAPERFEIGAIGKRNGDSNDQSTDIGNRHRSLTYLNLPRGNQISGMHVDAHTFRSSALSA
ncbi:MAG: hypothetical protein PVSMB8_10680 [Vulcanimicrobiaceae bacterium]